MVKQTAITEFKLNKENPFMEKAIEEVNGHIVRKYKTASKTDQKAILQAVDPKTGEYMGHTTFIRQIEVDEDKFTKIYLSQFSVFYKLKSQAIKVFGYIINKLIPNQDLFSFFHNDCLEFTNYKSLTSIRIGLTSLLENEIIARGPSEHHYFINPLIIFNGNRITFAKTYVKKRKPKDPNQLNVFQKQRKSKGVLTDRY